MGASGQAATNAQQIEANMRMQQAANQFTAQQGDINRDFNMTMMRDQMDSNSNQAQRAMDFNSREAAAARDWSAGQADIQRGYQTEMANTAWQRGIADMKKAGINPILAASLGGASSPMGSMPTGGAASGSGASSGAASSSGGSGASGSAGHLGNPGESTARGISQASQIGQQLLSLKQTSQAIDESKARTEQSGSQKDLNESTKKYQDSNVVLNQVLQDKAKQDTSTSAAQSRAADASAASHMSDAAYRAAQTITEGHNAHSAAATARIKAAQATNEEKAGPGIIGDVVASGARTGSTILNSVIDAWNNRNTRSLPVSPGHLGPGNRGIYGERLE